jgi:SAM-dependent methyltransferase
MAQNVYDDPGFFGEYARLERSVHGLEGAPEWPALQALLPPVAGRRVVDLGCGFGWFCRWAAAQGASSVVGVDLSARMLERAELDTDDERITYRRADLSSLELPPAAFDVAYSSLALHYLPQVGARAGRRPQGPGARGECWWPRLSTRSTPHRRCRGS